MNPEKQDKFWPWYILLLFIILAVMCSGCVSQRVPAKENNASVKLGKHLDAVEKIVNVYPDLVDSVRSDLIVSIELEQDTLQGFTPSIDSNAVNSAFDDYEKQLAKKDSLNKILESGLLNYEDSLQTLRHFNETSKGIQKRRFEVVKEVFKDTTVLDSLSVPLMIGTDSLELQLQITTEIKDGIPTTSVVIKGIKGEAVVEQTSPLFTVYNKIPWWIYLLLFIGVMILLNRWKNR